MPVGYPVSPERTDTPMIYRLRAEIFAASVLSVLTCLVIQKYILTGWSHEAATIFRAGVFLPWLVTMAVLVFSILAERREHTKKGI